MIYSKAVEEKFQARGTSSDGKAPNLLDGLAFEEVLNSDGAIVDAQGDDSKQQSTILTRHSTKRPKFSVNAKVAATSRDDGDDGGPASLARYNAHYHIRATNDTLHSLSGTQFERKV